MPREKRDPSTTTQSLLSFLNDVSTTPIMMKTRNYTEKHKIYNECELENTR